MKLLKNVDKAYNMKLLKHKRQKAKNLKPASFKYIVAVLLQCS